MRRRIPYAIAFAAVALVLFSHASSTSANQDVQPAAVQPAIEAPALELACPAGDHHPEPAPAATPLVTTEAVIEQTANGLVATVASGEFVVARIATDGSVVMACVDSQEAAARFLAAPAERLPARKAVEK